MLQVVVYLQISPMPCRPVQIASVRLCVCVLVYICPRSAVHDCQEQEKMNAGHRRYFSVCALFCLLFAGGRPPSAHSVRSLIERLCDREYKINFAHLTLTLSVSIFCSAAWRKHEFCKQPLPAGLLCGNIIVVPALFPNHSVMYLSAF
jgi:hypothetical protein